MKTKNITTLEYQYGDEEKIKSILYQSSEPILIKIKNFTDEFSLDYFEKHIKGTTKYEVFENGHSVAYKNDDFTHAITQIKKNLPYRIFGQFLSRQQSYEIEQHVPLWQTIPFRPRFFQNFIKVAYFFGGKDSRTDMHFDREHCCILHLCLSGKKQLLLFTEAQNDNVYKLPFIGDSLIDFSQPMATLCKQFPRINQAEGYNVTLETGDMLFMPKNCWHYTTYLDASASASYVFYPKKILQFYGYLTGHFFLAYQNPSICSAFQKPLYRKFSRNYALSAGITKYLFKLIEAISFIVLLPIVSVRSIISFRKLKSSKAKVY